MEKRQGEKKVNIRSTVVMRTGGRISRRTKPQSTGHYLPHPARILDLVYPFDLISRGGK